METKQESGLVAQKNQSPALLLPDADEAEVALVESTRLGDIRDAEMQVIQGHGGPSFAALSP
jgi:hypothetical protein